MEKIIHGYGSAQEAPAAMQKAEDTVNAKLAELNATPGLRWRLVSASTSCIPMTSNQSPYRFIIIAAVSQDEVKS